MKKVANMKIDNLDTAKTKAWFYNCYSRDSLLRGWYYNYKSLTYLRTTYITEF